MQRREWTVLFYVDARGGEPVRDFLEGLDLRTQARFDWSIEQLRIRNVQAGEPLVRHLEDKIWELRRESNTNIYRLLYAMLSGQRIMLLHGFQKKSRRTPPSDIAVAQRRLAEVIDREGGE